MSVSELQDKFGYDATTAEGKAFDTRKDISTPPFMDLSHVMNLATFSRPIKLRRYL